MALHDAALYLDCPLCRQSTDVLVSENTTLIHYPLHCPRCGKTVFITFIHRKLHLEPEQNWQEPGR